MKFIAQQNKLAKTLSNLVRNTDSKFPMFANIEIKCINNTLVLSASNGKISIHEIVDADILETTPIAVPAQKFYEIVSRLDDLIHFDNGLITCGKHKLKMTILRELEQPPVDFNCETVQIHSEELKQALKGRLFACNKNSIGVIGGVCLNGEEVVATDGNIMSLCKLDKSLPFGEKILDSKIADEIIKTFDNEINVGFNNSKIIIKTDKIKMSGVLLDGVYPKYKQIIPIPRYSVNLNKQEILRVLEIIKLTADKQNHCYFEFKNDKLIIGTNDGSSELDTKYNDEPMKIWFNINYMSDCLKNISNDIINFGFTEPLRACIIEAGNEKTLIMPVQKNNA